MRLGKYSGKLYAEDEVKNMQECGVCISNEQASDKNWINERHLQDLKGCAVCFDVQWLNRIYNLLLKDCFHIREVNNNE